MVKRGKRKIGSKTARNMMTLSHFRFRTHLLNKMGDRVVLVNESYTSKTCSSCFVLNHSLGGSKTFNCSECNYTIDRDVNGARNILIKNLSCLQESPYFKDPLSHLGE